MKRPLAVAAVVGTRPDVIKTAPLLKRLIEDNRFKVRLISTGQHRDLSRDALRAFGLRPDVDFHVMRSAQSPSAVFSAVLVAMDAELIRRPVDVVIVQGDTTSACAAAWAAFHRRIPVAHLEAGLRSGHLDSPFPEELNRLTIDRLAAVHLAPTELCRRRLLSEGVNARSIYVTGNTGVDALQATLREGSETVADELHLAAPISPYAVVTLHRRESHGPILSGIVRALKRAARQCPDFTWVIASHPSPAARLPLRALSSKRFIVLPPLTHAAFLRLLSGCRFAATDSGGIQEEAPSLGVPYLVLRKYTERPEALGVYGKLVGVDPRVVENALVRAASAPRRPNGRNPFGDGRASLRAHDALLHWAGRGRRPLNFR